MFALLVPGALAGSLVLEVGPETHIDVGRAGNWGRVFPAEDGWHFFFAAGGDYHHVPLDAELRPDLSALRSLTGRGDLVDHAIAACPDGTWLHVASRSVNRLDDSATTFRYGADLSLLATRDLYEAEPLQEHRDMPALCTDGFVATAFFEPDSFVGYRLVELGEDLAPVRVVEPEGLTIVTGSSLYRDGDTVGIVGFRGADTDFLRAREYDLETLALVDPHLQDVSPPGLRAYWSQGLARVGNRWVVAHMARDDAEGWTAQDGDVFLSVFNADWRFLEQVQVSANTPPNGGMQPWLAFSDDTLVVSYTRELENYAFVVRIDRVEAGLDPGPEDTADTAPADTDTSDTPNDTSGAETCGCGGGAALAPVLLLPALFVRRRC